MMMFVSKYRVISQNIQYYCQYSSLLCFYLKLTDVHTCTCSLRNSLSELKVVGLCFMLLSYWVSDGWHTVYVCTSSTNKSYSNSNSEFILINTWQMYLFSLLVQVIIRTRVAVKAGTYNKFFVSLQLNDWSLFFFSQLMEASIWSEGELWWASA